MPRKKKVVQNSRPPADARILLRDLAGYDLDKDSLQKFAKAACAIANSFDQHRAEIDDLRSAARDIGAILEKAAVQVRKLRRRVVKVDAVSQTSMLVMKDVDFLDRLLDAMTHFSVGTKLAFPDEITLLKTRNGRVTLRDWAPTTQLALSWLRAFGESPKTTDTSPFVIACEYLLPTFGAEFYRSKTGAHVRAALKMFKIKLSTK